MRAFPRLEGERKSGAICNSYFFPGPEVSPVIPDDNPEQRK